MIVLGNPNKIKTDDTKIIETSISKIKLKIKLLLDHRIIAPCHYKER